MKLKTVSLVFVVALMVNLIGCESKSKQNYNPSTDGIDTELIYYF